MRHSELTLLAHLSDPESLDALARDGFLTESTRVVIPTEYVRDITGWALDRFFNDGRFIAPSRDAIVETWADTFERFEIVLPDEAVEIDTIGYVIADLRSNHARIQAEKLTTEFANEMGLAEGPARVEVFRKYSDQFFMTTQSLITKTNQADGYQGLYESAVRLNDRMVNGMVNRGLHLGIDMVDSHMFGTHPGEITAVASEPGAGKSWLAGLSCYREWRRGRRSLLLTLENNVEMTYDRIACMATGIPYEDYQEGKVVDQQLAVLLALIDEMESSPVRPIIDQVDPSQRTASGVVRKAILEDADSLIIDQLSFLRIEHGSKTQGRNHQVAEILHDLKELVDGSERKIPVLLFVQINREGATAARKEGRYRKEHLAESSAVEQYADFVWAVYRSIAMLAEGVVQFQCLKARRRPIKHYEVLWHPEIGLARGNCEVDLDAAS